MKKISDFFQPNSARASERKPSIVTPSWVSEQRVSLDRSLEQYDYSDVHFKLEVLEHRIQIGEDEQHDHPVMAIQLFRDHPNFGMSRTELARSGFYRVQKEKEKVPTFWEKRCYDRRDSFMTRENSHKLIDEIKKISNDVTRLQEIAKKWERKTKRVKEVKEPASDSSSESSLSSSSSANDVGEATKQQVPTTRMVTRSRGLVTPDVWKPDPEPVKLYMPLVITTKLFSTDESCEETDVDMTFT